MDRVERPLTVEELAIKYDRKDGKGPFTDGPIIRSPSMGEREKLSYKYGGYDPSPWGWRMERSKLIEIDQRGNLGWSSSGKPYRKLRPEDDTGMPVGNCWTDDISLLNPQAAERLGYPTQKTPRPSRTYHLRLLQRRPSRPRSFLRLRHHPRRPKAQSPLDRHRRHPLATHLIKRRLNDALAKVTVDEAFPKIVFDIVGEPQDFGGPALALQAAYEFQKWALAKIGAQPYKGGDGGVDGFLYIKPEGKTTEKVIVSVKSGQSLNPAMVKDLFVTVNQENAKMGVFLSWTKGIVTQAASAGPVEELFGPSNPLHLPWQDIGTGSVISQR